MYRVRPPLAGPDARGRKRWRGGVAGFTDDRVPWRVEDVASGRRRDELGSMVSVGACNIIYQVRTNKGSHSRWKRTRAGALEKHG